MTEMNRAVDYVRNSSKLIIVTDYDFDGCSCNYVSGEWLRHSGHRGIVIMSDNTHPRGICKDIVDRVCNEYIDGAIVVTGDTGSGDIPSWIEIKERCPGIKIIVTDHHEIEDETGLRNIVDCVVNAWAKDSVVDGAWCGARVIWELWHLVGGYDMYQVRGLVSMAQLVDQMPMDNAGNREWWRDSVSSVRDMPMVKWALKDFRSNIPHDRFLVMRVAPIMNSCQRFSKPELMVRIMQGDESAWREAVLINQMRKKETKELMRMMKPQVRANRTMMPYLMTCVTHGIANKPYCGLLASAISRDEGVPVIVWNIREDGGIGGSARTVGSFRFKSAFQKCGGHGAGHEGAFGVWADTTADVGIVVRKYAAWAANKNIIYSSGSQTTTVSMLDHDSTVLRVDKNRPYGNSHPYPVFKSDVTITKVVRNAKNISIFKIDDRKGGEIECLHFDKIGEIEDKMTIEYELDIDLDVKYIVNKIYPIK